MSLSHLLSWLENTSVAQTVRESGSIFPWIESVHVIALALVVGSISVVDLRLLGVTSLNRSVTRIMKDVLPITWAAFAVALVTGAAMFSSNAVAYSRNIPFQLKLVALALAAINMLVFHLIIRRNVTRWIEERRTPVSAKVAGGVSMVLWVAVVALGRWIGFTMDI